MVNVFIIAILKRIASYLKQGQTEQKERSGTITYSCIKSKCPLSLNLRCFSSLQHLSTYTNY